MKKEEKRLVLIIIVGLLAVCTPEIYRKIKLSFAERIETKGEIIKVTRAAFNSYYTYSYEFNGERYENVASEDPDQCNVGDCVVISASKDDPSNSEIEKFSCD